ncbi:DUF6177 family protein [Nocardiopsis sp. YSL2]|uniref:DUF6177 family protein n=1 Tax=Nocardiopsis sp. YSL2 TaxID=2939492 RepID=UPI0026F47CB1|nr:DUF6177 family protein [Nocardiopsis sp. YSL2]
MTYDVVALTEELPDVRGVVAALVQAGPDLGIWGADRGGAVRLRDGEGRHVVTVEAPRGIATPWEVVRLLGEDAAEGLTANTWWVDVRSPSGNPEAAQAAHRLAESLVKRHGGTAWPPSPQAPWAQDLPRGSSEHPVALTETAQARVLANGSPVVSLTAVVADAMAESGRDGRAFHLLTPAASRLTHPLRVVLAGPGHRWVVERPHGRGHVDGITGVPLTWDDELGYRPRRDGTPPALARGDGGSGLVVDLRVLHNATDELRVGGTVERIGELLCSSAPRGWGTSEPALSDWDAERITDLCRDRAPRPTRLVVTGPAFSGTLDVRRVVEGVREDTSLAVGTTVKTDDLPDLVAEFADSLQTLTVRRVPGAVDAQHRPVLSGASAPVGLAIGPSGVSDIGLDRALNAPVPAQTVGPRLAPAVWYRLDEDRSQTELFQDFRALMDHLRPPDSRSRP